MNQIITFFLSRTHTDRSLWEIIPALITTVQFHSDLLLPLSLFCPATAAYLQVKGQEVLHLFCLHWFCSSAFYHTTLSGNTSYC